jgi:hypothetical protein
LAYKFASLVVDWAMPTSKEGEVIEVSANIAAALVSFRKQRINPHPTPLYLIGEHGPKEMEKYLEARYELIASEVSIMQDAYHDLGFPWILI